MSGYLLMIRAHDQDEIQGAIECEIHAGNLSSPAKKIIPVKITVKSERTRDDAAHLVTDLSNRASRKERRLRHGQETRLHQF